MTTSYYYISNYGYYVDITSTTIISIVFQDR